MNKNNDNGYVLVTSLLLLLVLTVVGLSALNTSTVENMLSGNTRLRERNVTRADGGIVTSTRIIREVLDKGDTEGFADIISDANLEDELRTTFFDCDDDTNPDVSYSVDDQDNNDNVQVDIDKMYNKWGNSAVEFAAGYEGLGYTGAGGFKIFYRINATGTGLANSEAQVGSIYQYTPN